MKRVLPIVLIVLTVVLIAMATIQPSELSPAKSPDGAVQSLFAHVKAHDYKGAYAYVAKSSDTDEQAFAPRSVRTRRQPAHLLVAAAGRHQGSARERQRSPGARNLGVRHRGRRFL